MTITELVDKYVRYRHSLGEKFETNQRELRAYTKFIGSDLDHTEITTEKNLEFLYYPTGKITAHWFTKHTALRGLFLWCMSRGYLSNLPIPTEIPKRLGHIPAFIYTKEQLKSMFECEVHSSVFYDECTQTILKLTYCLGLRISETIALKMQDIDLANKAITIHTSKFYKSRICPFNDAVKQCLTDFLAWRHKKKMSESPDAPLFYTKSGEAIKLASFQHLFIRIRQLVGLDNVVAGRFKPRLHDLRHTFAVNRLRSWYAEGADVQTLLPILSTYLGHKTLAYTSVYLTMTPELLSEVNKRFANYANLKDYNYENR